MLVKNVTDQTTPLSLHLSILALATRQQIINEAAQSLQPLCLVFILLLCLRLSFLNSQLLLMMSEVLHLGLHRETLHIDYLVLLLQLLS